MNLNHSVFEIHEGIGWLRFNRPKQLNSLNPLVFEDIAQAAQRTASDPAIRALVMTGNGRAFAAGADIKPMARGAIPLSTKLTDISNSAQQRLAALTKPSIAAIAGYALGGGCEVALCCDFRLAAENAIFGLPEIKLEQSFFCMLFGTEDQKEGMAAFIEKRTPNFSGR